MDNKKPKRKKKEQDEVESDSEEEDWLEDLTERFKRGRFTDGESSYTEDSWQKTNNCYEIQKILVTEEIGEDIITKYAGYTLDDIREGELTELVVNLIRRYRKIVSKAEKLQVSHVLNVINSTRLLLLVVSKESVLNKYFWIYKYELWRSIQRFLKCLARLLTQSPQSFETHTDSLVSSLNSLDILFVTKHLDVSTRDAFESHLLGLLFSRGEPKVKEATAKVLARLMFKYNQLPIMLRNTIDYKCTTLSSTGNQLKADRKIDELTLLLIEFIDLQMLSGTTLTMDQRSTALYSSVTQIVNVSFTSVLTHIIPDLIKICKLAVDKIPRPAPLVFVYYLLLSIDELFGPKPVKASHSAIAVKKSAPPASGSDTGVVDGYFKLMSCMCALYKQHRDRVQHLPVSGDLIHEVLDQCDREQRFPLACLRVTNALLVKRKLDDADLEVMEKAGVRAPQKEAKTKRNMSKGCGKVAKVELQYANRKTILSNKTREYNLARCYNYVAYELLKEITFEFSISKLLERLGNNQVSHRVLNKLRGFLEQNGDLVDEPGMNSLIHAVYKLAKTTPRKDLQKKALEVVCLMGTQDARVHRFCLVYLFRDFLPTAEVCSLRVLTEFYQEVLSVDFSNAKTATQPITEAVDQSMKKVIISALLARFDTADSQHSRYIIVDLFTKLWIKFELSAPAIERKVNQVVHTFSIHPMKVSRLMNEILTRESFGKDATLGVRQIVDHILNGVESKNVFALKLVRVVSEAKPEILLDSFRSLMEMIKEMLTSKETTVLGLLVDITADIVGDQKRNLSSEDWGAFEAFVYSQFREGNSLNATKLMKLAFFCPLTDNLKLFFFKGFEKVKRRLENLERNILDKVTLEETMISKELFSELIFLCSFLHTWPQVIDANEDIKTYLAERIPKFAALTKNGIKIMYALHAMGELHLAFPEVINMEQVKEMYGSILVKGEDVFKVKVTRNITAHLEKLNAKTNTPMDKKKETRFSVKHMDTELTGDVSLLANHYKSPVLDIYLVTEDKTLRRAVVNFLKYSLECGAFAAPQVMSEMISMLTDSDTLTVREIHDQMKQFVLLDDTLLLSNLPKGILASFKLQKVLMANEQETSENKYRKVSTLDAQKANETDASQSNKSDSQMDNAQFWPLGYLVRDNNAEAKLSPLLTLATKRTEQMLQLLIQFFKKNMTTENDALFAYLVENLVTLPYASLWQIRIVLYELHSLKESKKDHLSKELKAFAKHHTSATEVGQIYFKSAQIEILVHMERFLTSKYVLPKIQDLLESSRYEESRAQLKINAEFNQYQYLTNDLKNSLIAASVRLCKQTYEKQLEFILARKRDETYIIRNMDKFCESEDDDQHDDQRVDVGPKGKQSTNKTGEMIKTATTGKVLKTETIRRKEETNDTIRAVYRKFQATRVKSLPQKIKEITKEITNKRNGSNNAKEETWEVNDEDYEAKDKASNVNNRAHKVNAKKSAAKDRRVNAKEETWEVNDEDYEAKDKASNVNNRAQKVNAKKSAAKDRRLNANEPQELNTQSNTQAAAANDKQLLSALVVIQQRDVPSTPIVKEPRKTPVAIDWEWENSEILAVEDSKMGESRKQSVLNTKHTIHTSNQTVNILKANEDMDNKEQCININDFRQDKGNKDGILCSRNEDGKATKSEPLKTLVKTVHNLNNSNEQVDLNAISDFDTEDIANGRNDKVRPEDNLNVRNDDVRPGDNLNGKNDDVRPEARQRQSLVILEQEKRNGRRKSLHFSSKVEQVDIKEIDQRLSMNPRNRNVEVKSKNKNQNGILRTNGNQNTANEDIRKEDTYDKLQSKNDSKDSQAINSEDRTFIRNAHKKLQSRIESKDNQYIRSEGKMFTRNEDGILQSRNEDNDGQDIQNEDAMARSTNNTRGLTKELEKDPELKKYLATFLSVNNVIVPGLDIATRTDKTDLNHNDKDTKDLNAAKGVGKPVAGGFQTMEKSNSDDFFAGNPKRVADFDGMKFTKQSKDHAKSVDKDGSFETMEEISDYFFGEKPKKTLKPVKKRKALFDPDFTPAKRAKKNETIITSVKDISQTKNRLHRRASNINRIKEICESEISEFGSDDDFVGTMSKSGHNEAIITSAKDFVRPKNRLFRRASNINRIKQICESENSEFGSDDDFVDTMSKSPRKSGETKLPKGKRRECPERNQ